MLVMVRQFSEAMMGHKAQSATGIPTVFQCHFLCASSKASE